MMIFKRKKKTPTVASPIAGTFQIIEAYKNIRTNLLFTLANSDNNIVAITGAEPNAGKSTATANLAITMAQTGAKVLIIDADMRRPSLHKTFRVKRTNGLSMILSGMLPYEECICHEVAKSLDFIPSGSTPPNPSELLGSEAMDLLLERVKAEYDYIFIDLPPLGVVSDALLVGAHAAGIVLICRQRQTTYEELQHTIENIRHVNQPILGVVITDVKQADRTYGWYEKYHYYKRYDYSYSHNTADSSK